MKALPLDWIERLFTRFVGMYGSKFADLWRGTDLASVKSIWAEDLVGYSGEELKRGLESCKVRVFPPTLPEFMILCRPPLNPESAFHEAVKQLIKRKEGKDVWSSKAIYWAAQSIGDFDMNQPWQSIGKRWTAEFNAMLDEESLPDIPAYAVALPPPGKTTIAPEEGKKRVAEAVKQINAPRDHKAWASKLIEQEASGAGRPHPVALAGAREALGTPA